MAHKRTASDAWIEKYNPLRGLSINEAQWLFDASRNGNYALIQWIFSEIEKADPILMTCVERRTGALSMLGPKSVPVSGTDDVLQQEQCDCIDRIASLITNLPEALEHLGLAFFRGFSHVMPVDDGYGRLSLELMNNWNFCRHPDGSWLWNPTASSGVRDELERVNEKALCTVERPRMIDYPAMAIFLRSALAERDWGRFIERYGIPPCIITMPAIANKEEEELYRRAAEKVANAISGALPNGSTVNFATEARGTDPFSAFVEHQHKLTVLLSTGGTLTSLAEAGSGTLAGNAQMDVWNDICKKDAVIVGAALDRSVFQPALRRLFPGRPICARFELETAKEQSPSEIFDIAAKARAAGYLISQEDLEAMTGFKLEKAQENDPFGAGYPATPLQNAEMPLQNARRPSVGKSAVPGKTPSERILRAVSEDVRPASDAVLDLIQSGINLKSAEKLKNRLNGFLPKDPKAAQLIADEIATSVKGTKND